MVRRWRPAAALLLAGALLLVLAATGRAGFRYRGEACTFAALYRADAAVDLVVFGSSRAAHAVDPAGLPGETLLLARDFRGLEHVAVTLRDMADERRADERRPRRVLIEYDPQAPTGRNPVFPAIARWPDLWSELAAGASPPPERLADGLRLATGRLASALRDPAALFVDPAPPAAGCAPLRDRTDPLALSAEPSFDPVALPADGRLADRRDQVWLDRILALARDRDIELALLFVPARAEPPPAAAWRAAFERRTGARWLVPPEPLRAGLDRDGYAGPAHLNGEGRRRLTAWLADAW